MRKLLVTLDKELEEWLKTFPNQNEIIRESLRIYKGNVSTDTLVRLRAAFVSHSEKLEATNERLDKLLKKIPEY